MSEMEIIVKNSATTTIQKWLTRLIDYGQKKIPGNFFLFTQIKI